MLDVFSRGAWVDRRLVPWRALGDLDVALVTALARSDRVVRFLAARGVTPRRIENALDHATPRVPSATEGRRVDVWLATAKCATHLPSTLNGIPLATIDYAIDERAMRWLP